MEFHRLVGVERFFLYNNLSADHHREVLAPYMEEGIVTLRDWPVFEAAGPDRGLRRLPAGHRDDSRWIAFIDLDEFLFSPSGEPLPEVLADYEQWPGVAVRWACSAPPGTTAARDS